MEELAKKFAESIFLNIVNPILTILFLFSLVYFIWTIIAFLNASPEEKGKRISRLVAGIVGLFIIISTYTILYFIARLGNSDVILQETLFFDGGI